MASLPFEQLIQGLTAEHELQQATIHDLRLENRLLREQLGLCSSPEDEEAKPDSRARQLAGNNHDGARTPKLHRQKSKQKVAKTENQSIPPIPLTQAVLDNDSKLPKKHSKSFSEPRSSFHRGPGRAMVSHEGIPKPGAVQIGKLALPDAPQETDGLRSTGLGQDADNGSIAPKLETTSDSEVSAQRFSVRGSCRNSFAIPMDPGEESDSALVGVSRGSRAKSRRFERGATKLERLSTFQYNAVKPDGKAPLSLAQISGFSLSQTKSSSERSAGRSKKRGTELEVISEGRPRSETQESSITEATGSPLPAGIHYSAAEGSDRCSSAVTDFGSIALRDCGPSICADRKEFGANESLAMSDYPSAHMFDSRRSSGCSDGGQALGASSLAMSDYPSAHMFKDKKSSDRSSSASSRLRLKNGASSDRLSEFQILEAAAGILSDAAQERMDSNPGRLDSRRTSGCSQRSSGVRNIHFGYEEPEPDYTPNSKQQPMRARFRSKDVASNIWPSEEDSQQLGGFDSDSSADTVGQMPSLFAQRTAQLREASEKRRRSGSEISNRSGMSGTHSNTSAHTQMTQIHTHSVDMNRDSKIQSPELWPIWKEPEKGGAGRKTRRNARAPVIFIENATGAPLFAESSESRAVCQWCIVRPNSKKRLTWDLMTILMVGYDVITIPLVAFELDQSGFTLIMNWVTSVFWTMDLPGSFMTGYHTEGIVEMRPRAIAHHYVTTWFVFDFMIVITDWFFLIMSLDQRFDAAGLMRYGKTTRINRILRAMRLLRFMKLQRVLADVLDMVKSEYMQTLFNVALSITFIVTLNHYLACGWYLIGSTFMKSGMPNWIEGSNIQDEVIPYRYTTSIHWSLTQFTPAGMEVRPYNIAERLYSIVVLLFALITFSSFLGSITTAMTQLRKLRSEQAKQQALLRRYFLDNKVSTELGQRIWKFIKTTHFSHKSRTHTKDIAILRLLPSTLRNSLNEELYRPYVTRIPVFEQYMSMESEGLCEICHKTVEERAFIGGDELFSPGQESNAVYLIVSGWLDYTPMESQSSEQSVDTGGWVCEHSIWLKWEHIGTLIATTSCETLLLKPDSTRAILAKYPASLPFLRAYASFFEKWIRLKFEETALASLPASGTEVSDIWMDVEEITSCIRKAYVEIGASYNFEGADSADSKDGKGMVQQFGKTMSMLGGNMAVKKRFRLARQAARGSLF